MNIIEEQPVNTNVMQTIKEDIMDAISDLKE